MSKNNWLYDENGEVRKQLYQMSSRELDEKQLEVLTRPDLHNPPWSDKPEPWHDKKLWPSSNPALSELESGDVVYIDPSLFVAKQFGGRMTFIAFAGSTGLAKCMFCRTEDGGGGFIDTSHLVDPSNPKLR